VYSNSSDVISPVNTVWSVRASVSSSDLCRSNPIVPIRSTVGAPDDQRVSRKRSTAMSGRLLSSSMTVSTRST
jgi:hypothetical protein